MDYKLTYIHHDCFILDTEKAVVVFDYWKDPLACENKDFPPFLNLIDHRKNLYILVSHHHKDHFSRRIFFWYQRFPHVKYIISHDTYKKVKFMFREDTTYSGPRPDLSSVTVLKENESFEDDIIQIQAFGSTDIGNSYALATAGLKVFHAGDLNAWIWKDESTEEEVNEALSHYTEKVNEIALEFPYFDLAMFPVDSRLGTDYFIGARLFVRKINVGVFVPMHFELVESEDQKLSRRMDAADFSKYANVDRGEYVQLAASRSCLLKTYFPDC